MSFKSLESQVNNAIIARLYNRTLTIDGTEVNGIFEEPYLEVGFTESSNPTFTARTADMPDMQHGTKAEADDFSRYEIVGIKPDATGMTVLELRVEWLT